MQFPANNMCAAGERDPLVALDTKADNRTLALIIRKILSKSKSGHFLRIDSESNQVKLKADRKHLGVIYLEAPYIALANYEVRNLINMGKCCGYCGEVLKIYETGKMKDDGKKSVRERRTSIDKHERYLNGLDCTNCEVRWCDKQCLDLDFKHNLLYHRPSNKSASHSFVDVNGVEKDTFLFDNWAKLKKALVDQNLGYVYNGVMCILHIYYDSNLKEGFESLANINSGEVSDFENFLNDYNSEAKPDYTQFWQLFNSCFKKLDLTYLQFLKYITIYQLNNYSESIYLIFSSLNRSHMGVNCKIEYCDDDITTEYEEFIMKPCSDNNVRLFKERVNENHKIKPIFTNRTSGVLDKKIIQVLNTTKLNTHTQITIFKQDYTNPIDFEDDEIGFISDEDIGVDIPRIVLPITNNSKLKQGKKVRNASFTSSGASFGEGIIKYNRDQIREMLENMSNTMTLEEVSSIDEAYDDNVVIEDDAGSSVNSSVQNNFVSMMRNLQIAPGSSGSNGRRKSVKFEDTVTTIA